MAIDAPEVGRPTEQYDEWLTPRWRRSCRLLLLLWLAVLLAAGLLGEKESSFHDLEASLAEGSVSAVEITGLPRPESTGRSLVTVRWEGRFVDRFAEVAVTQGPRDGSMSSWAEDLPHFRGDALVERLRVLDQDVQLIYVDHRSGTVWNFLSWEVPQWVAVSGLAAWLSTFMLAAGGPEPWRATRAAWFWLVLLGGWIGVAAFLLLGGPLGTWQPHDRNRRLTGGWAFLLALLLGSGSRA